MEESTQEDKKIQSLVKFLVFYIIRDYRFVCSLISIPSVPPLSLPPPRPPPCVPHHASQPTPPHIPPHRTPHPSPSPPRSPDSSVMVQSYTPDPTPSSSSDEWSPPSSPEVYQTSFQRFSRKFREEPLVPVGSFPPSSHLLIVSSSTHPIPTDRHSSDSGSIGSSYGGFAEREPNSIQQVLEVSSCSSRSHRHCCPGLVLTLSPVPS